MTVRTPALLLLVLLLAGCGRDAPVDLLGSESQSAAPTTSASPLPPSVTPDEACPRQEAMHLAADQGTVTDAFVCGAESRAFPGDGVWLVRVVWRITGGLDALLAVYGVADAGTAGEGTVCASNLPNPLVVFLHSDGAVHAVRAPWDSCGKPTAEAVAARGELTTTSVWEHKDRQTQTQQSIDTHCEDRYKDTLSLDEQYGDAANRSAYPTALADVVSVCSYRVEPDAEGDRIGRLDGHRELTQRQVEAVNAALARVRVDETCSRHEHSRFALLSSPGGPPTVVALDGCAVEQNGSWWRAGDDLRAALQ